MANKKAKPAKAKTIGRRIVSPGRSVTKNKAQAEDELRAAAQKIMPKGAKLQTLATNSHPPAEWWEEKSPF
jgi:hypothetical protein